MNVVFTALTILYVINLVFTNYEDPYYIFGALAGYVAGSLLVVLLLRNRF